MLIYANSWYQGQHGLSIKPGVVPGSDGAGVVEAVGSKVSAFKPGDSVCTHMTSRMAVDEPATFADIGTGLGQQLDGTLRQYGVFHESSLVKMPSNLSFLEAATLTCSALTAWNALFGLEGKTVKKGDVVLVQGSGGVSISALQVCQVGSHFCHSSQYLLCLTIYRSSLSEQAPQ